MARKGIFLVLSRPSSDTPEGIAAYHRWYDEHHVPDSLHLPGFVNGRRFKIAGEQLVPPKAADPDFDFVALYELDDIDRIPDARVLMGKLAQVYPEFFSPLIDSATMKAYVLEQISEVHEPNPLPEGVEL